MLTIQTVMMVALGFLLAVLVGLLLLPAYRKRTVRLTSESIKNAMPLSEDEIRADKDRLRADFAITVHDLEGRLERVGQENARQRVEINRRDAVISGLEGEVAKLGTALEEHENARRVLEQTIMDRLPKVELRLAEAKKLLVQRDKEIAGLSASADMQAKALEEATQINTKNRDEIHRLTAALNTRASRNRDDYGADSRFDGEVALRSEIEALRAKTRDQASMISRLQALVSRGDARLDAQAASLAGGAALKATNDDDGPLPDTGLAGMLGVATSPDEELSKLRSLLAEAETKLHATELTVEAGREAEQDLKAEVLSLKQEHSEQKDRIRQLQAELKTYRESERSDTALAESKMAMKARIAALESQAEGQGATIQSLRAEIAAANERLARQATHYMEEMRRLGAGMRSPLGSAQSGKSSRSSEVAQAGAASASAGASDAESGQGTTTSGSAGGVAAVPARPSLSQRINEPRAGDAVNQVSHAGGDDGGTGLLRAMTASAATKDSSTDGVPPPRLPSDANGAPSAGGQTVAGNDVSGETIGSAVIEADHDTAPDHAVEVANGHGSTGAGPAGGGKVSGQTGRDHGAASAKRATAEAGGARRRGSLLERITRLERSKN